MSHGICAACAAGTGVFAIEDLRDAGTDVLDALPWGALVLDEEARVMAWTPAGERMAQSARSSIVGRLFFREIAPYASMADLGSRYREMVLRESTATDASAFILRSPGVEVLVQVDLSYSASRRRGTLLIHKIA